MKPLAEFVRESNRIEGIAREPTSQELTAHVAILDLEKVEVPDLEVFVATIQPGAILRRQPGQNVRIGRHVPPGGGEIVERALQVLLDGVEGNINYQYGIFNIHRQYETLHPFTDGNGRSGRALWLWMMYKSGQIDRALGLGFLHAWYYQSLAAAENR